MEYIKYVIIAAILVIVLLAILKANKKDAGLDFNKLVEYLGGKDNIIKNMFFDMLARITNPK